jgi:hypothetical protein
MKLSSALQSNAGLPAQFLLFSECIASVQGALMWRVVSWCVALVIGACGVADTALAGVITYKFTGQVDFIEAYNDGREELASKNIRIGTTFRGHFTYDNDPSLLNPYPRRPAANTTYYDTNLQFKLNIAGHELNSITSSGRNFGTIFHDGSSANFSMQTPFRSSSRFPVTSSADSGIYFLDEFGTVLPRTTVPKSLSLADLTGGLYFSDGSGNVNRVYGRFNYLTPAKPIIPPPSLAPTPPTFSGDIVNFDPSKPTVVITHGWQPLSIFGGKPRWVGDMAEKIRDLIPDVGDVNVIEVYWKDAETLLASAGSLRTATAQVANVGKLVARELQSLSLDFSAGIHFVGHSLGTHVNAYAANTMTTFGTKIDQFTILDRPFGLGIRTKDIEIPVGGDADQLIFRTLLPKGKVKYVENFYGGDYSFTTTPATGSSFFDRAVVSELFLRAKDHVGVQEFYTASIGDGCELYGFGCSRFYGEPRFMPKWDPLLDGVSFKGDVVEINPVDWLVENCIINDEIGEAKCKEGSPAYLWQEEFTFAEDAEFLAFDFNWLNVGDGDWLSVFFDDILLFSFSGGAFAGSDYINSGLIPVFDLAGQTGQFLFTLNSVGSSSAEIAIKNIIVVRGESVIPEPNSMSFLFIGGTVALIVRRKFGKREYRRIYDLNKSATK